MYWTNIKYLDKNVFIIIMRWTCLKLFYIKDKSVRNSVNLIKDIMELPHHFYKQMYVIRLLLWVLGCDNGNIIYLLEGFFYHFFNWYCIIFGVYAFFLSQQIFHTKQISDYLFFWHYKSNSYFLMKAATPDVLFWGTELAMGLQNAPINIR
jgi:hypothetical protein